jgi:flagellar FliL protein
MADTAEDQIVDEEEGKEDGGKKKKARAGGFIPRVLRFVAIGLIALIFIVTVTVITYFIVNKGGKNQTTIPTTESYEGIKPVYAVYTLIGQVVTRTRDDAMHSVTVDMLIEYDLNDNAAATELTGRQYQLRDFVRRYFSGKYAAELRPENEGRIKQEVRELLNTTILETARARNLLFNRLEVNEM